jgi:hypothetical protein
MAEHSTEIQQIARRITSAGGEPDWDRIADAQAIVALEAENTRLAARETAYCAALAECIRRISQARLGRARVPFRDMQAFLANPDRAPQPWVKP